MKLVFCIFLQVFTFFDLVIFLLLIIICACSCLIVLLVLLLMLHQHAGLAFSAEPEPFFWTFHRASCLGPCTPTSPLGTIHLILAFSLPILHCLGLWLPTTCGWFYPEWFLLIATLWHILLPIFSSHTVGRGERLLFFSICVETTFISQYILVYLSLPCF